MRDAGVEKKDIQSLVFTLPRPYTRQKYFHTFLMGQLRLACRGSVMEVMGNGMTAALAFDQACNEIVLGRAEVALALGINMESAVSAAEHAMSSMRTTGDVDFHDLGRLHADLLVRDGRDPLPARAWRDARATGARWP